MLEQELLLERDLFLFLNGINSPFWDNVMYTYSYMFTWIPFYLCGRKNVGAIAQLVEQRTENPCVPSSILGGTTKAKSKKKKTPESR